MENKEMLNKILTKLDGVDQRLDQVIVSVVDIKEHQKSFSTKDDLEQTEGRILTGLDRFVKLHETLDQELVAMRNRYDRLEERLSLVEQKVGT